MVNLHKPGHQALKVLLVEDSIALQRLLNEMLADIPEVEVVGSVESEHAAIDAINSAPTDLAIIDLELKAGTGLGLLKAIKQNPQNSGSLEVVVFSNYSNLIIRHRCLSLGAQAFFDKSFQVEELLHFVQQRASKIATGPLHD